MAFSREMRGTVCYFVRGVTGGGKGLPHDVAMSRRLGYLYRHWSR